MLATMKTNMADSAMAVECTQFKINMPAMEITAINKSSVGDCCLPTPFVIDVNLEDIIVNNADINIYSILINPEKHKTVSDVMNKLKLLFNLKNKFYLVSNNLSILPEMETIEILYYLKNIRVRQYGKNCFQPEPALPPITRKNISIDENYKSPSPDTDCNKAETDQNNALDPVSNIEDTIKTANINGSKRYTKSFSVGSFLNSLRHNDEENEHNNSVNGNIEIPMAIAEQEDSSRKRKRTRRRKKKDVSYEETESEVSSSKCSKPYSFNNPAHEESKHLRFTDNDSPGTKDNTLSDEENLADSLIAEVDVEMERSRLDALLSLKKTPVVFVRSPIAT